MSTFWSIYSMVWLYNINLVRIDSWLNILWNLPYNFFLCMGSLSFEFLNHCLFLPIANLMIMINNARYYTLPYSHRGKTPFHERYNNKNGSKSASNSKQGSRGKHLALYFLRRRRLNRDGVKKNQSKPRKQHCPPPPNRPTQPNPTAEIWYDCRCGKTDVWYESICWQSHIFWRHQYFLFGLTTEPPPGPDILPSVTEIFPSLDPQKLRSGGGARRWAGRCLAATCHSMR